MHHKVFCVFYFNAYQKNIFFQTIEKTIQTDSSPPNVCKAIVTENILILQKY